MKTFHSAKAVLIGYQHRGEDFAIFEVETDQVWNMIPFGDEGKEEDGSLITVIAGSLGIGKQVLRGQISKLVLDRPLSEGDINWAGTMLLQLSGVNGGASGSGIIADAQRRIVGVLVGTIGGTSVVGVPVSKVKAVIDAHEKGKYPWYAPASSF